jgi:5-methylcytosine-specific restriction enzyme subunit McrC
MAVLSIHEHTRIKLGSSFSVHSEDPTISHREYEQIARLNLNSTRNGYPEPFEIAVDSIKSKQHVGVVSFGQNTIEVLPKIDTLMLHEERISLLTMLCSRKAISISRYAYASLDSKKSSLIELFFSQYLEELNCLVRCGLIGRYVSKRENLSIPRGKILINRPLSSYVTEQHRIHCEFDEFSINNSINQLLKSALCLIQPHIQLTENKRIARELLVQFSGIDLLSPSFNLPRYSLDRLAARYALPVSLAKLFLDHSSPELRFGPNKAFSMFFDMNKLFEDYIALNLKSLMPQQVLIQQPTRYLAYDRDSDSYFRMRPDVLVQDLNKHFRTVIDTKWKQLTHSESTFGILQSDIYQVLTYARQYGCKQIALIYPATTGVEGCIKELNIRDGQERLRIFAFNLRNLHNTASQLQNFNLFE